MEMIPPVLQHHHPQHHPRIFSVSVFSVPISIPMPRNPFYHCCSLSRRPAAAANASFRPFFLSLINPYPPSSSSSTHRPFFRFRFSFTTTTTTTRSFCAAATSTPTTTTISSPNSATTIPHHHVEQEEPSIPSLPLLLQKEKKKKKTKSGPLMTKESVAQMKHNWLSSLNNPPNHPPPNDNHVPNNDDWVIGIDPDVSGALALLKPPLHHHDSPGVSAQVFDSPHVKVLIGNRTRRRLDTKAITELLQSFDAPNGTIAYLEQSLPYPGDGKQGWWSGGFNYGIWIGVLVALGFSVVPVPSLLWKNQFKLSGNGSSKDGSREAARMLFPSISSQLTRKKDHGRAEALLIAAYGKGLKMGPYSSLVSEDMMPLSLEC